MITITFAIANILLVIGLFSALTNKKQNNEALQRDIDTLRNRIKDCREEKDMVLTTRNKLEAELIEVKLKLKDADQQVNNLLRVQNLSQQRRDIIIQAKSILSKAC